MDATSYPLDRVCEPSQCVRPSVATLGPVDFVAGCTPRARRLKRAWHETRGPIKLQPEASVGTSRFVEFGGHDRRRTGRTLPAELRIWTTKRNQCCRREGQNVVMGGFSDY
jgi:hypothetical protein